MRLNFLNIQWSTCCLLALAFSTAGCGSNDARALYTVTGDVTFDGAPVETGRILFRQTEGEERAFSGEIIDGKYDVKAEAGRMSVSITAARPNGKFDRSNDIPIPLGEMYIPAKYNSETTLTVEVADSDSNVFPFHLESK